MDLNLKATLKTDVSKKGTEYQYVELVITDKIKKRVFLDPAELELLMLSNPKLGKTLSDPFGK